MHVEFQPAPEALHDGDRAALAVRDAGAPAAPPVPAEHRADERVVEREAIAQTVRHGEHPLAYGDEGQDGVDEVRRLLGHAPAAAARADGACLTGERDEALEPAGVAPHAGEAAGEDPAAEEVAELALDEARHACAVAGGGRLREKAVEVRAHDSVEHRPRRRPWLVDPRQHAGARANAVPPFGRSAPRAREPDRRDARPRVQRPMNQVASGPAGPLSEGVIRPVRRVPRNPNAASCRRANAETINGLERPDDTIWADRYRNRTRASSLR